MPTAIPMPMPPDIVVVMPEPVNVMIAIAPVVAISGHGDIGESQRQQRHRPSVFQDSDDRTVLASG
jgi:hypothetical protein